MKPILVCDSPSHGDMDLGVGSDPLHHYSHDNMGKEMRGDVVVGGGVGVVEVGEREHR